MPKAEMTAVGEPHDGGWIDHPSAAAALEEFRYLLGLSRQEPMPWFAIPILFGEPGVGKSAAIDRFIAEVRRPSPWGRAEDDVMPATKIAMPVKPDAWSIDGAIHAMMGNRWRREADDRTTLLFVEQADHLLDVSLPRRNQVVARLRVQWSRFLPVFVGSPELAQVLAPRLSYQPLPMAPLAQGPEFASVVAALGGTDDPAELARLHGQTAGIMGRLVDLCRRGRLGRPGGRPAPTPPRLR